MFRPVRCRTTRSSGISPITAVAVELRLLSATPSTRQRVGPPRPASLLAGQSRRAAFHPGVDFPLRSTRGRLTPPLLSGRSRIADTGLHAWLARSTDEWSGAGAGRRWEVTTTLGAAEALSADVVITRELIASVGEVPLEELRTFRRTAERDLDSTHSRWPQGRPGGRSVGRRRCHPATGPGSSQSPSPLNDGNRDEQNTLRSLQVLAVLRSAVVYWLPGPTAHGMAQMTIATDDLVDVCMPHNHVLTCFGSGFALESWSGGEGEISRGRRYHVDLAEAVAGRPTPPDQVPAFIRNPTLALFRGGARRAAWCARQRWRQRAATRPVAEPRTGRSHRWHRIDHPVGRSFDHGSDRAARLSLDERRRLGTVVVTQRRLLPSDPRSKQSRRALRDPSTRAPEVSGQAGGVRVLDAPKMHALAAEPSPNGTPAGTHASPLPHWRRGHVQRYRVGPRDNWSYEERQNQRQLVNRGGRPHRAATDRLPAPAATVTTVAPDAERRDPLSGQSWPTARLAAHHSSSGVRFSEAARSPHTAAGHLGWQGRRRAGG